MTQLCPAKSTIVSFKEHFSGKRSYMFLVRCFLSRTEALWAFVCIVVLSNKSPKSWFIISPSLWLRTLPHLPEHGGGLLNHSRNGLR